MADEINEFVLYNAPAGSGKTTTLKRFLRELHYTNPKAKFLCITFTNRAAEEMKTISSIEYVYSSTIHSYISDLIKPYLKLKTVINDYIELFKDKLLEIINNPERNAEKINRYKEKKSIEFDNLTLDLIKNNIGQIEYGETPFTSYLYGRLGHDDLLLFSSFLFKKYNNLNRRITDEFNYVFIDEYQDTNDLVIELFYNAVKKSKSKLFLFGDRMQQIYGSNNFFLIEHLDSFKQESLSINYRSSQEIVNCLNHIYNDTSFVQTSNNGESGKKPKFVITSDINHFFEINGLNDGDFLKLHLLNRDRYDDIGVLELFTLVSSMEDYRYGNKYTAVDVLNTLEDNPDQLFKVIYRMCDVYEQYISCNIGAIFNIFKNDKSLLEDYVAIKKHSDKSIIKNKLDNFAKEFESDILVIDFVMYLKNNFILSEDYEIDFDDKYSSFKSVKLQQFYKLYVFLKNSHYVSTQHGVKGESHKNVIFISSDSNNSPYISTSQLYKLFSFANVSYNEFEQFNYLYKDFIQKLESTQTKEQIVRDFYKENYNNQYFNVICKSIFDDYFAKPTPTNLKKIGKTLVEKVFQAYKLFYVGCSRAMENLYVIVEREKVDSFCKELSSKMNAYGFDVVLD